MSILNHLFFRSRDKPANALPDDAVAMVMGFARATVGGEIQMSIYDQGG